MTTTTECKTERSAKIRMTKMNKAYEAKREEARQARWNFNESLSDEQWAAYEARGEEASAIYGQMVAFRAECKALGWYVNSDALRYSESATTALILANID